MATLVETIDVRNPVTNEVVGRVVSASPRQVSDAVGRARSAQPAWERKGWNGRAGVIQRFHDRILDRNSQIFDLIQSETGKTRRDALGELVTVAGTARYYLANGREHLADRRRQGAVPILTHAEVVHRPHGVVGLITPWNYPFLLPIADAIPALLAGNAVVIKPSEFTPLSAQLGRDLLLECGLDPDLLTVLPGRGDVGVELIRHVDYVGFTGGTETGRKVAVGAAQRLIPFSLELGGKNPMVVLKGAPINEAAKGLVAGAFSNSGQTCISIERVYVEESIFDEFAKRVVDETSRLRIGWSNSWDIDVGSLINPTHAHKVISHVEDAIQRGAKVMVGGRKRDDLGPAFVEPTVLSNVHEGMMVAEQETFGPVVSLYRVGSAEEAVTLANNSSYGLHATVWSKDSAHAARIARRIETGSVAINSTLMIYNTFDVPMGGMKTSGVGRRHGEHGILRYTQAQSIVTSFAFGGGYDAILSKMRSDARVNRLLNVLRLWRRI